MSRALDGRVNNQHGTFLLPHASQSLNCALLGFQNATLTLRQEHWDDAQQNQRTIQQEFLQGSRKRLEHTKKNVTSQPHAQFE
mmetsp:Transcript_29119/g.46774  ORF Transcript_29119/g.46774 Transcript_29119/m.46774 type:complete len:83 (-) Transcript_29119:170-418(-)